MLLPRTNEGDGASFWGRALIGQFGSRNSSLCSSLQETTGFVQLYCHIVQADFRHFFGHIVCSNHSFFAERIDESRTIWAVCSFLSLVHSSSNCNGMRLSSHPSPFSSQARADSKEEEEGNFDYCQTLLICFSPLRSFHFRVQIGRYLGEERRKEGGGRRTQNRDYLQIGPLSSSSSRERKKEISLSSLGPKRNSLPLSFRFSVPFYRISRDCKKTASLFRPRKTLLKNKKRWRCLTQVPPLSL